MIKNLPAKAEDIRNAGLIPRLGRSPGKGHGNPKIPQYSCLENLMDRGARQAIVHGVSKSPTGLSNFHFLFWVRMITGSKLALRMFILYVCPTHILIK